MPGRMKKHMLSTSWKLINTWFSNHGLIICMSDGCGKISHFHLLTVSVSVFWSHLSQYIQSSSSSFECSKKVFRLFPYRVRKIKRGFRGKLLSPKNYQKKKKKIWLTLTLHMIVFIPYHTYHFQHR